MGGQGAGLIMITLLFFLGSFRSALIVAFSLPLCALMAVLFMRFTGLSVNFMSLGGIAIAIGMFGDASIVMVENIHRHLSYQNNKNKNLSPS